MASHWCLYYMPFKGDENSKQVLCDVRLGEEARNPKLARHNALLFCFLKQCIHHKIISLTLVANVDRSDGILTLSVTQKQIKLVSSPDSNYGMIT